MPGFALDHTPDTDDGIEVVRFSKQLCAQGKFETSGNMLYKDIVFSGSVTDQRGYSGITHGIGDIAVPVGDNDSEAHFVCIRNLIRIIGGQIFKGGSHRGENEKSTNKSLY
jgi:hypothetical protein